MDNLIWLQNRSLIEVSGPDAHDFLQGILTNDIDDAQADKGIYAGLLTPQGKLLFDFFVVKHPDGYLIDVDKSQTEDLVKRLMFYKLRANVTIVPLENTLICASLDPNRQKNKNTLIIADPRYAQMGFRVFMLNALENSCAADPAQWLAHRIACGIPEARSDYTHGDCFPHDIAMDQLNGIGFKKGCYVGQEVVSRMQHRGTARKRPMRVTAMEMLPAAPARIEADGSLIGQLGSVYETQGIAQIRLDRAVKALKKGVDFNIEGIKVELISPQWADYGPEFNSNEI